MRIHHKRVDGDSQLHHTTGVHSQRLDEDQIRAVYRFMYRHVGNREDAEDLTERTCSQTVQAALSMPTGQSMDEFLWQTARSVVARYLCWFYGSSLAAVDAIHPVEQADRLIAHLPTRERDFLTQRFLNNGALAETATMMRMTLSEAQALQYCALADAAQMVANEAEIPAAICANAGSTS